MEGVLSSSSPLCCSITQFAISCKHCSALSDTPKLLSSRGFEGCTAFPFKPKPKQHGESVEHSPDWRHLRSAPWKNMAQCPSRSCESRKEQWSPRRQGCCGPLSSQRAGRKERGKAIPQPLSYTDLSDTESADHTSWVHHCLQEEPSALGTNVVPHRCDSTANKRLRRLSKCCV